jgi:hypothetical protein
MTKSQRIQRYLRLLPRSACFLGLMALGQSRQFDLPHEMNARLRWYIQHGWGWPGDKSLRYTAALVDRGDKQKEEIVIYLSGKTACGTGGCTLLILKPLESSFQEIGYEATAKLPIRSLHTQSKGRRDIGVWKQWGFDKQGIAMPGKEDKLQFDGNQYMTNRAGSAEILVPPGTPGDILIPKSNEGRPVFDDK